MEAQAAIGQALSTMLSEKGGGFVMSWLTIAEGVDDRGQPCWYLMAAPGQRMMQSVGLAHWMKNAVEYDQMMHLREEYRPDE